MEPLAARSAPQTIKPLELKKITVSDVPIQARATDDLPPTVRVVYRVVYNPRDR
jgi:hypothetical protein